MPSRRTAAVAMIFAVVLVVGLALWLATLITVDQADSISIISSAVGILVFLVAVGAGLWRWASPHASSASPEQLSSALSQLAVQVHTFWVDEAARRGITLPATVSVDWSWVVSTEAPSVRDVLEPWPHGVGPPAMSTSTFTDATELLTDGTIERLHDLYSALPNGRLVVLGEPGTGKTGALILLLLSALRSRESLPAEAQSRCPVPVLLPLTGWDPTRESLELRVAETIRRDHPYLEGRAYGRGAIQSLFRSGSLALFLDGLDEMPAHLRRPALEAIDQLQRSRVVIACRAAEYREVSTQMILPRGAVIRLTEVSSQAAADYLTSGHSQHEPTAWKELAQVLRAHPDQPVSLALKTPLALSLARSTYRDGGDPRELTDAQQFPDPARITRYLLQRLLDNAYPASGRTRAVRYLSWLAREMSTRGTRDLEWWQIRRWVAPEISPLIAGLAFALTTGLIALVAAGPAAAAAVGSVTGVFACGIAGILYSRLTLQRTVPLRGFAPRVTVAVGIGLVGLVLPTVLFYGAGQVSFLAVLVGSVLFGVALGVVIALVALHEIPMRAYVRWPQPADILVAVLASGIGSAIVWIVSGPVVALVVMAMGVLTMTIAVGWSRPPQRPREQITPLTSYEGDMRAAVIIAVGGGTPFGIAVWLAITPWLGQWQALTVGLLAGIGIAAVAVFGASQAVALRVAGWWLFLAQIGPSNPMTALARAREHEILRQVGAVYQFRHGDLQDYLAEQ